MHLGETVDSAEYEVEHRGESKVLNFWKILTSLPRALLVEAFLRKIPRTYQV